MKTRRSGLDFRRRGGLLTLVGSLGSLFFPLQPWTIYLDDRLVHSGEQITVPAASVEVGVNGTVRIRRHSEPTPVTPGPSPKPPPLEGRYWIVGQTTDEASGGYSLEVSLNGESAGEFGPAKARLIEVTNLLIHGKNLCRVRLIPSAIKAGGGAAPPASSFSVLLAPGTVSADRDQVSLGYPILVLKPDEIGTGSPPPDILFHLPPPPDR